MYVLYVCIICMYYMYVLYVYDQLTHQCTQHTTSLRKSLSLAPVEWDDQQIQQTGTPICRSWHPDLRPFRPQPKAQSARLVSMFSINSPVEWWEQGRQMSPCGFRSGSWTPPGKADNWIPVTNWSTRKVDGFRLSLENHHEGSNLGNSCLCRERLRWRYCPKITARRLPTCSRRCMCSCACLASNMPGPLLGSDRQISRRVSTPWRTTCCLPGRVGVAAPSQASCAQKDISLCHQALEIGWQRSKHPTNLMN